MNYEKIYKRFKAAEENKNKWQSLLDDCYDYFLPDKSSNAEPGQSNNQFLFDSTAQDALGDYASKMESSLVPPGRQWMKLEAGTDIPEEKTQEINGLLEKTSEIVFAHINSSNFSGQINECFLDLGISTGAIIIEEGDGIQSSLRFRSVPLKDLYIERSTRGLVETVFRRLKIPGTDFIDTFPYISIEDLPQEITKKLDKPDEIEVIEGVIDVPNGYLSVVLYEGTKDVLYLEQLESSPWVVFREATAPGETYGRGRAMRCLPDTKTLNKVVQYYIETCELLGNPIYTAVDDGLINPHTITIRPKTVIPVGASDTINALPLAGHPELNIDLINRLQDSIRRTMLSKPFGQIDETPVRTATEMAIRNADIARSEQSASGRIQTELLERIIKRCLYILKELGKVPDIRLNGREVKIKITSPTAKNQDELDIASILRFMESIQAMGPEMVQTTVKTEEIPSYLANKYGVDSRLLRNKVEQQSMVRQIQEANARAQGIDPNTGQAIT
jgi:hypothetical protein